MIIARKIYLFNFVLIGILVIFITLQSSISQISILKEEPNPLTVYFFGFPSEIENTVDAVVLLQVSYDKIRFLKKGEQYVAVYDFTVELFDGSEKVIDKKYWSKEFILEDFKETLNENEVFLEPIRFSLKPGFYRYYAEMTDTDSKKSFYRRESKIFSPYWAVGVGVSDLILSYGTENKSLLHDVIPKKDELKIPYERGFSIQLQLFSSELKPVVFVWNLKNTHTNAVVLKDSITLQPTKHTIDFSVGIAGSTIPSGSYMFQGQISNSKQRKQVMVYPFKVVWTNKPISSYNPSIALEQMVYILLKEEYNRTKRMIDEEKRDFFETYWKARDPIPETPQNELMDEYFYRVDYADEYFSYQKVSGWKTDRGRIYCIYGKPDMKETAYMDIQRTPVEVWTYKTARKQFTFIDLQKIGMYELKNETDIIR
jgi:GWxTD domain-containing protein